MKIFVTGATGFIGARLTGCLLRTGHQLTCLVRPTSDIRALRRPGVRLVVGDITIKSSFLETMRGCDAVIHLAGSIEFWVPDTRVYRTTNVDGTRNVLEAALATGVAKVIHVSTAMVWGKAEWPISEDTPLGPTCASEYARTKREGDLIAWRMHAEQGLPLVGIYPGGALGPNDPKSTGRYIRNYARARLPAQVSTRTMVSLVHVQDVCEAIRRALEKDGNIGEKYLVVSENPTLGEVNQMIAEIAGTRLPRLQIPWWLAIPTAYVLTAVAGLTKRPPLWDLSVDQVALMRQGFRVDGSKVVRDLGLTYTPIRKAIRDAIPTAEAA